MKTELKPQRFTKKPVTIEAVVWNGSNVEEITAFMGSSGVIDGFDLYAKTLEGRLLASVGDFIIKGIKGEFYPCKPDIFEMTYTPEVGSETR